MNLLIGNLSHFLLSLRKISVLKISASIYSNLQKPLPELVLELEQAGVDMLHVDCNDTEAVFEDIAQLNTLTTLPIDLHIISERAAFYLEKVSHCKVDFCCLQKELLVEIPTVLANKQTQFGIAFKTETALENIDKIIQKGYNYIMLMCTTPGKSGGTFQKENFQRIIYLKQHFPQLKIQVDGGVDSEIAFVLRLLGVDFFVSGSYLVNNDLPSAKMVSFFKPILTDKFSVKDFMLPVDFLPILHENDFTFYKALEKIEAYKFGFVLITNTAEKFVGIITNADCRRALLANFEQVATIQLSQIANFNSFSINENKSLAAMWHLINEIPFIILFLPVINDENKLTGAVLLNTLTRG